MPRVSLRPYTLTVTEKGKEDRIPLGATNGMPLSHAIYEALQLFAAQRIQNVDYDSILVKDLWHEGHQVAGTIMSGSFGQATDIVNVKTQDVSFRKSKDEADLWPYFFYYDMPPREKAGYFVIQKTGVNTPKKQFSKIIDGHLRLILPKNKLTVGTILEPEVVAKLLNSPIKAFTAIKFSSGPDIADLMDMNGQPNSLQTEYTVRTKSGVLGLNIKKKLSDVLNQKGDMRTIFSIPDFGEPDEIVVEAEVEGRIRRYSVNKSAGWGISLDVSDNVERDDVTQQPKFESMLALAQQYVASFRSNY